MDRGPGGLQYKGGHKESQTRLSNPLNHQERESYEHLFPTNSMVSDILLVGWYQPWWEYFVQVEIVSATDERNISSGNCFLHIYQYTAVKWKLN